MLLMLDLATRVKRSNRFMDTTDCFLFRLLLECGTFGANAGATRCGGGGADDRTNVLDPRDRCGAKAEVEEEVARRQNRAGAAATENRTMVMMLCVVVVVCCCELKKCMVDDTIRGSCDRRGSKKNEKEGVCDH
jgi:hypothetical protein